jgi:hypothetical protein
MLPYTLLTRIATAHGSNLMETPIHMAGEPLAHWTEVVTLAPGTSFAQGPASSSQVDGFDWRQQHELLRLELPLAQPACRYAADTPGGVIERPAAAVNGREQARWEVPAISWIASAKSTKPPACLKQSLPLQPTRSS